MDEIHRAYAIHIDIVYARRIQNLMAIGELAANLGTAVGSFQILDGQLIFDQAALQFSYHRDVHTIDAQGRDVARLNGFFAELDKQHGNYPYLVAKMIRN
jgi:hypothetical protein